MRSSVLTVLTWMSLLHHQVFRKKIKRMKRKPEGVVEGEGEKEEEESGDEESDSDYLR